MPAAAGDVAGASAGQAGDERHQQSTRACHRKHPCGPLFLQASPDTSGASTATASITPASGYVLAGSNPEHDTSASVQFTTSVCHGGSTGGGSGCAMHAPSLAGHQAGRHPDLISCG